VAGIFVKKWAVVEQSEEDRRKKKRQGFVSQGTRPIVVR